MQLFLAAAPAEVREASRFTRSLVHVAYRIGPSSSLMRHDLLLDTQKRIHLLGNSFTGEAADATIAAFDGFAAKYFASYYEMLQRYVQFLRTSVAEGYSQTQKKNVGLANQLN